MIALDTNILVYARQAEMEHHRKAERVLDEFSRGEEAWAIPWPCIYEFVRVVTHPRIFKPANDLESTLEFVEVLLSCPSLHMLGEGPAHLSHLRRMVSGGRASGSLAYDAHIAALAVEHGVSELWTTDRGFAKFPGLRVRNPFLPGGVREKARKYRARTQRPGNPAASTGRGSS